MDVLPAATLEAEETTRDAFSLSYVADALICELWRICCAALVRTPSPCSPLRRKVMNDARQSLGHRAIPLYVSNADLTNRLHELGSSGAARLEEVWNRYSPR